MSSKAVCSQLRRLERRERLAAARRMPDVSAAFYGAVQSVVVCYTDFTQNAFRRHDLIRTHDEQHPVGGENAVAGQQVEQRVFGEECTAEAHKVSNRPVVDIGPPRGEFEAVARLLALGFAAARSLLDMALACGIAVILGIGSVRYDEELHKLEQPAACPETLPLVAVDLIESLLDVYATPFQLEMNQRQTVHQYGNVVTVGACAVICFVLIDDLKRVVMDIGLVEQVDIFDCPVVVCQQLHMVFLNDGGLFYDSAVLVGNTPRKEARPLLVGKGVAVEFFQLAAQVGDQLRFGMNRQVLVSLFGQQFDKRPFELGLRLILFLRAVLDLIVADDRAFWIFSYKVVFLHLLCA